MRQLEIPELETGRRKCTRPYCKNTVPLTSKFMKCFACRLTASRNWGIYTPRTNQRTIHRGEA